MPARLRLALRCRGKPPLAQDPARTKASAAGMLRDRARNMAMARSAQSSVSTSGVLVSRMPRARQVAMSTAS